MPDQDLIYYILFDNYDQGLALYDLFSGEGIESRITPAPGCLKGRVACGMSLMLKSAWIGQARACIEKNQSDYHEIASVENQMKSTRDRYC